MCGVDEVGFEFMGLFVVKNNGTMVQCDQCNKFEHLSCRGRSVAEDTHKCYYCAHTPTHELQVYFVFVYYESQLCLLLL